ncbi:MAG TPA: Na+/H+ antiporter subunit E [Azoarcus taiwanensis]|uniref:Cation:proton antiporter n=1 Tax=Azoarcus taiwanensis TaxID=666964 RepID=A0A972F909_9RHOO|nr:Na+/H+ antiporter subunit E [Azoarcus taiwanensis]NMG02189.1 cation:proton antiporter [Azoarcus taiwanensis]HRQ58180.1 Na+/H+ antiporter subunit E [Azoarcus taiwanensis]
MLGIHILLAVGIAAFANALDPMGIVGAFVLVYLVLKLGARLIRTGSYLKRLELGIGFVAWFAAEIVKASLDVARIVVASKVTPSPAVITMRLEDKREGVATLIGLLLTLTPGTMALDYDPDSGEMAIHALNATSVEEVERGIRELERRLLDWMHPERLAAAEADEVA